MIGFDGFGDVGEGGVAWGALASVCKRLQTRPRQTVTNDICKRLQMKPPQTVTQGYKRRLQTFANEAKMKIALGVGRL